jgi:hypothetical protein
LTLFKDDVGVDVFIALLEDVTLGVRAGVAFADRGFTIADDFDVLGVANFPLEAGLHDSISIEIDKEKQKEHTFC